MIGLAVLLTVSVMLAPLAAEAQGWLALVAEPPLQDEFRRGMRELRPLPGELQSYIGYTGGIGAAAKEGEAGKALLNFLKTPAAVPVLKAKGMEPITR